jgi:hypothetical protein
MEFRGSGTVRAEGSMIDGPNDTRFRRITSEVKPR